MGTIIGWIGAAVTAIFGIWIIVLLLQAMIPTLF
jgi:hypothetical protein